MAITRRDHGLARSMSDRVAGRPRCGCCGRRAGLDHALVCGCAKRGRCMTCARCPADCRCNGQSVVIRGLNI